MGFVKLNSFLVGCRNLHVTMKKKLKIILHTPETNGAHMLFFNSGSHINRPSSNEVHRVMRKRPSPETRTKRNRLALLARDGVAEPSFRRMVRPKRCLVWEWRSEVWFRGWKPEGRLEADFSFEVSRISVLLFFFYVK